MRAGANEPQSRKALILHPKSDSPTARWKGDLSQVTSPFWSRVRRVSEARRQERGRQQEKAVCLAQGNDSLCKQPCTCPHPPSAARHLLKTLPGVISVISSELLCARTRTRGTANSLFSSFALRLGTQTWQTFLLYFYLFQKASQMITQMTSRNITYGLGVFFLIETTIMLLSS